VIDRLTVPELLLAFLGFFQAPCHEGLAVNEDIGTEACRFKIRLDCGSFGGVNTAEQDQRFVKGDEGWGTGCRLVALGLSDVTH
jgi:hypothetical protein